MNTYLRSLVYPNGYRSLFGESIRNIPLYNNAQVRSFMFRRRKKLFKIKEERYWFSWRSVFTRWTPIATVLYGTYVWHRGFSENITNLELTFYCHLPFRMCSKLFGKLANTEVPVESRPYVYGKYSEIFNVNLEEAITDDFTQYETLADFFARSLKDGVRPIDKEFCLVSPCDGKILNLGPVTGGRVEQVKGVTYNLKQFLGKNTWIDKFFDESVDIEAEETLPLGNPAIMEGYKRERKLKEKQEKLEKKQARNEEQYYKSLLKHPDNILYQCTIYLAPGDYHRFHSPCDWIVRLRKHFRGKLLSVNPVMAKLLPGLFSMNERAVYIGHWKYGFFSYAAVGATNVGSIKIYKDDALKTNGRKRKKCLEIDLDPKIDFEKGEMVGQFNMGSTIVLLFEAPKSFEFFRQPGDVVKMGIKLGHCTEEVKGDPSNTWKLDS